MAEEKEKGVAIHQTHRLILRTLKDLLLFSVDSIEKNLRELQKEENGNHANIDRPYILSIEEI
jgi:hypothetical protein